MKRNEEKLNERDKVFLENNEHDKIKSQVFQENGS